MKLKKIWSGDAREGEGAGTANQCSDGSRSIELLIVLTYSRADPRGEGKSNLFHFHAVSAKILVK